MNLDIIDFELPEHLIAQTPLEDRAASRMLTIDRKRQEIAHRRFRDITELLQPGDLLVFNQTRVSAVRLYGRRPSGGQVEALLLGPAETPDSYRALVKPARKLGLGQDVTFEQDLRAKVIEEQPEGMRVLQFEPGTYAQIMASGSVPLPPYIHTKLEQPDRYQTVYAKEPGSAAAPTAGLHFTEEILESLRAKGIDFAYVTLDVGLDTFRPLSVDDPKDHQMHGERCAVSEATAAKVVACRGRVVAVGTTTTRTLESFATAKKTLRTGEMVTDIFIYPGHTFQIVDAMMTNFHLPRTTMLLMLSALTGSEILHKAYQQAIKHEYRFLSFGDAMFIG